MTGPEHYREAERLTALAASIWSADEDSRDGTMPDAGLSTTGLFAEVRAEQILREIREARRQDARQEAIAILASAQVHATLALAEPQQPTADMVARRTIRALRARGWRPPRDEDDDYARDELHPQPGDPPGQMPPHAHGYPVGGRAPHVSGEHNWRDCPDLSEPYAAPGDGAL